MTRSAGVVRTAVVPRVLWSLGVAFVVGWAAFNVALLGWVVLGSFRGGSAVFTKPFALPEVWSFGNYVNAWVTSKLGAGFFNSVLLVGLGSVSVVGLAALAAYPLSRTGMRSAGPVTTLFAMGLGIPLQIIIVPLFVFMNAISNAAYQTFGWWDSRISLYILYVATSLPFAVFLLTGFFRSLPTELEEAAALDGAGPFRTFRQIMWPLARPGLTTAMLLTGLGLWNETLLALVFITDDKQGTLPRALLGLYSTMQYTSNWGGLFAGIVIVVVPTIVVYVVLGRRIVEGMTLGSVK
ncbi:carbohydrate ABC transporter permease [Kribbella hippodromi]|uniref:Carbohydrate ABC transporter permease n=1 Tax=Kribbella hippodromi TaxID=434347 RepID=A0ABP4P9G0_9ACTN